MTPGEIRSRETAYKATEHWWKSRVEEIVVTFERGLEVPTRGLAYAEGYDRGVRAVLARLAELLEERAK